MLLSRSLLALDRPLIDIMKCHSSASNSSSSSLLCRLTLCTLFSMLSRHVIGAPIDPDTKLGCPAVTGPLTLKTQLGTVIGADMGDGVTRFTLPFAQPPLGDLRFANPQPITTINGLNASQTPPRCYQADGDARGGNPVSEDCLYTTFYRPKASKEKLPIMVWYHGGSGIGGGSTQAGLDGTKLASSQNVIVAFPQYRLSLFGWLQTQDTLDEDQGGSPGTNKVAGNQALRDAVMALEQVRALADALGGDAARITIMGQSSGALLMRALLTTPAAQTLFNNAILVSDTANYGLSSIDDNNELGADGMKQMGCEVGDLACARGKSADDVLYATFDAFYDVPAANPRVNSGTPWRPTLGKYVTSTLDKSPQTLGNKKVIMTTVSNEMGAFMSSTFEETAPGAVLLQYTYQDLSVSPGDAADLLFNNNRGTAAANDSALYPVDSSAPNGLFSTVETIGTDGMWRCPVQYNVDMMARSGAQVWLAEWQIGSVYPDNAGLSYCTQDGHVCHEDDIFLIFGTMPNPSAAQSKASKEMQERYASFARSSQPNAANAVPWTSVQSSSQLNMLAIGKDGTSQTQETSHPAACSGKAWGSVFKYDWQLYPA